MNSIPKSKLIEPEISRRRFLKVLSVMSGSLLYAFGVTGCGQKEQAPPTAAADTVTLDLLQPENQALGVVGGTVALAANALDSSGELVYRQSSTQAVAYSRRCPHQGCQVGAFENKVATCACHGSQFDVSGQVVHGPAREGLAPYRVTLTETELQITHEK